MKLEDLHTEWAEDAKLGVSENLDAEASRTPQLHAKYTRYLSNERLIEKKLNADLDSLTHDKVDWLTGVMAEADLKKRGWEPERRRILHKDLERHLAVDTELVDMKLRLAVQREKVDMLVSVVKMIMNRNFVVKNMIDWVKFKSGVN